MIRPSLASAVLRVVALAIPLALSLARLSLPASAPLGKLDPALAAAARMAPDDTLSFWVAFRDKGEESPADLAARLAAAEAALTPKARARRLRARVFPLVDDRDLPVHPAYVDALTARGFRPIAVSRWLNQVATRAPGSRLPEIAALDFVTAIHPVERMRQALGRSVESEARPIARAEPLSSARSSAIDYGTLRESLDQIGIPTLHDQGDTGAGVLVAVIDDGFNFFDKHEALRDLIIPTSRQRDFVRGVQDAQDTTNSGMVHGTWVLGCLGGRKFGTYVGAAFDADFALARTEVVESEKPVEMLWWGMGAEWADSLGADIITSSLAYTTFDSAVGDYSYGDMDGHTTVVSRAAEIAASKGVLVFNAVGNLGQDPWHYLMAPSDVDGDSVVAVGAVNLAGVPAAFSSYGPSSDGRIKPDLAANGNLVPLVATTGGPQDYSARSGTSFSTPLVAGLAACLLQARPSWTPRDLIRALRASASQAASPDDRVGYGIPNGPAALCGPAPASPAPGVLTVERRGVHPVNFSRGPAQFRLALAPGGASTQPREAVLAIRDAQGREVGRPWSGVLPCGLAVNVSWDGRDRNGRRCGAGLFVVELRSGNDRASARLVCLP